MPADPFKVINAVARADSYHHSRTPDRPATPRPRQSQAMPPPETGEATRGEVPAPRSRERSRPHLGTLSRRVLSVLF